MNIVRSPYAPRPATAGQVASPLRVSLSGRTDFDAARVERVRGAIAAGTHAVDAEAIAGRMLADPRARTMVGLPAAAGLS